MNVETLKALGIKLTPEQIKSIEDFEALETYRSIVGEITYFNDSDTEAATNLVKSIADNAETLSVLATKVVGKSWWQVGFTVPGLGKVMVRLTPGDME